LLGVFYLLYGTHVFEQALLVPFVTLQADVASFILNLFGAGTGVRDALLVGPSVSLNIAKGCDGLEATVLFLFAVGLMPFSKKSRAAGLLVGGLFLVLLNMIRIAGLYLAKAYWPEGFELLHIHGGFALFTLASVLLWAGWAGWAMEREKISQHETS
jgi:exosortase/archaeosortase family protein